AAGGPRLARPAEDPDAHEVVEGSPEDAVARVVVGAFAQDDLQMFRARHQQRPDDAEVETDYFSVRRPADAFELLQGVPGETRQGPIERKVLRLAGAGRGHGDGHRGCPSE